MGLVMFRRRHKIRNAPRLPSFGPGKILDLEGRPVQDCLVKEISQTGVNIVPDDPKTLPATCEIWIPHLSIKAKAHVRWNKKNRAGLEFDKPLSFSQLSAVAGGR